MRGTECEAARHYRDAKPDLCVDIGIGQAACAARNAQLRFYNRLSTLEKVTSSYIYCVRDGVLPRVCTRALARPTRFPQRVFPSLHDPASQHSRRIHEMVLAALANQGKMTRHDDGQMPLFSRQTAGPFTHPSSFSTTSVSRGSERAEGRAGG